MIDRTYFTIEENVERIKDKSSLNIQPLVSIACVTYNHEKYIKDALESFLIQKTDYNFEIIIHDDASTDSTQHIIKEYAAQYPDIIRVILQTENQLSKGIKPFAQYVLPITKGKYIAICEGDDFWNDPNKIQNQVGFLENNPHFSACFHPVYWLENGNISPNIYKPVVIKDSYSEDDVLENLLQITVCSTILRKSSLDQISEKLLRVPYWDNVLHYLNVRNGNIGYINKPMATYRRHANGYYSGDTELNRAVNTLKTWKIIENEFGLENSSSLAKRYFTLFKKIENISLEHAKEAKLIFENNLNEGVMKKSTNDSDVELNNTIAIEHFFKSRDYIGKYEFEKAEKEIIEYKNQINYELFEKHDNRKIESPVLSVLIVAYNTKNLLLECLSSLVGQTDNNFEIIIIDNGENEEVKEKLLAENLLYIKCPINLILSEGRNVGAHFAKGKIIAFLDDDAITDENWVSGIISAFENNKIWGLRGKVLPKDDNALINAKPHYNLGNEFLLINYIDTEGNSAFLRNTYLEFGGMNPLLFGNEGFELSYRIQKQVGYGKLFYSPDVIIYHDYACSNDKLQTKTDRHNLMNDYLRWKYSDIESFRRPVYKSLKSGSANEKEKFISICIPTYNRAKILSRAIKSALNQYYSNFEIVIVDDGSTDNTKEIVESFQSDKITYKLLGHVGAPSARNESIRTAKGEYILWLDSDDEMVPEMLAEYNNVISSTDAFNILYCNNVRVFDETAQKQEIAYTDINGRLAPEKLLFGPQIANCGALIKKSLIEKVGYYNEDFKRAHDFEFWVRALPYSSYKHVNKFLYYQHFHDQGNLSPIYHEKTDLSYEKRIINYLVDQYPIKEMFPNVNWRKLNSQSLGEAKALIYAAYAEAFNKWNDNKKAQEYLKKSMKLKKTDEAIRLNSKVQNELKWEERGKLPITAIISAFNEGDLIYHVVKDLIDQNIDVYFIDNNSTDNTVDEVKKLLGKGVVKIEKFPQESNYKVPSDKYVWRYLLKRKEEISNELGRGWYIHADADEFRESPWENLNLRDGIEKVNEDGYNALNFKIYDFKPIDNSFAAGSDVRNYLNYYSKEIHPYNNFQIKAWKNFGQGINLWESGGHNIQFLGRKVYPMPFILRHYSIRSQEHGIKKIFDERKKRYDKTERDALWHQHYDHIESADFNLLSKKSDLVLYNKENACREIQTGKFNFTENRPQTKKDINKKDKTKDSYYEFSRPEVQALVNPESKFILDVGCAGGNMASELKNKFNAEVWGIEPVEDAAKEAKQKLDNVLINTVEDAIPQLPDKKFDTIVMADVLEHLEDPYKVLEDLKSKLSDTGEIVISIPNVNHFSVFKKMLAGDWEYEDAGILDKTHLRFFTRKSVIRMLKNAGYQISDMKATAFGQFNLSQETINSLKKDGIDTSRLNENLNHYQYLVKANPVGTAKKTSVVVPVYNQINCTKKFIDSILNFSGTQFEVVVVDNKSDDETVRYLKELEENDDRVKVIYNSENNGFPVAVNQGIKVASGDYIVIANNDIVVTDGWLERMVEVAEMNKNIGLVGPISNEVSGVQIDKEAKYGSIEEMHQYARSIKAKNLNQIETFPRVAFLCTLIKREVIDKIGGLDERFSPGNFEDDDFCLRAQLAGFQTVIAKDIFIHHYGSVSFKANGTNNYAERLEKNKKIFVEKWNADPDEIWLKGKEIKKRRIDYPINQDSFVQAFNRALLYIEENEFNEAMNEIKLAIQEYELSSRKGFENLSKADVLNVAATLAFKMGDLEQSKFYFELELEAEPESSRACLGLAEIFYEAELFDEAKTMYEWAIRNGDNSHGVINKLNELNKLLGYDQAEIGNSATNDDHSDLIYKAEELINNSDLDGAEGILNEILSHDPYFLDALNDLAVVKILQNNYSHALLYLNNIISIDPSNEIALEHLTFIENEVSSLN